MFDKSIFFSNLKTDSLGKNIVYFSEIDSTNEYLLKSDDIPFNTVVVADIQKKGKGRSGRVWESSFKENLYFSMLLSNIPQGKLLPLNIVVGFSVCDVLREFIDCYLKWPNDIICGGKKVCGILLESRFDGNRLKKVVCGIGINVNMDAKECKLLEVATSIYEQTKKKVEKEVLLAKILNHLEKNIDTFIKDRYDISKMWPNYSYSLNKEINITVSGKKEIFIEKGIDSLGGLKVIDKEGIEKILYSGDVGYDFCS